MVLSAFGFGGRKKATENVIFLQYKVRKNDLLAHELLKKAVLKGQVIKKQ